MDGGVHGLTVEGVAARSGVAKTTIYRRYRSKYELALAVVLELVEEDVPMPDLGDTRAELVALVGAAVRVLGATVMGRVMQGLVSDFAADAELGDAFRAQVITRRLAEVERLLERGVQRGQVRPGIEPQVVQELLFGAIYYRLLLSGSPLDEGLAERVVDAVMPWLSAAGQGG